MRCARIKQNYCRYGVDKERTQHNVGRILGVFSIDVVRTALGNSSISTGCSIILVPSTAWATVGCWRIGAQSSILWIGVFLGVMLWGPRTSCPKYPCAYNISDPLINASLSTIKLVSKEHPYIPNKYTYLIEVISSMGTCSGIIKHRGAQVTCHNPTGN